MRAWLFLLIFTFGCIAPTPTRDLSSDSNASCNPGEQCVKPGDGGIDGDIDGEPVAKVEIRHLIDPFEGTYQRKLTIPKNYRGNLYVSGLNLQTIRDKLLYVRFKFGMAREVITYEATLGRGQGITPNTEIDVLILDVSSPGLEGKRFEDLRLIYDLYDYNDYDFTSGSEPVTDNLDINLYCRGLYLEDDPSFTSSGSCSAANSECRYGYAKVLDQGLSKETSGTYYPQTYIDLKPNVDLSGRGYTNDDTANSVSKCLPDTAAFLPATTYSYDSATGSSTTYSFAAFGSINNIEGTNYQYNGPYRALNEGLWQITGSAMYGTYGLFQGTGTGFASGGFGSYLFPRYSKLDLQANVQHLSNSQPDLQKTLVTSFPVSGETNWMDGCNARALSYNQDTNEHIGSCNVSASIEILYKDLEDGQLKVVAGVNDGGRDVKLQLVRNSETNVDGNEVLYSSLNQCTNSYACGSNECCFSNRCWSRDLVSMCPETASGSGNLGIGSVCTTDFDCNSLCCSPTTGRCEVHNPGLATPVLCSKPPGQVCIGKEWCMKQTVSECYIVKTGFDQFGSATCEVRCYNVERFGDCTNGICTPPIPPDVPSFNPTDPNACATAIDPPF
jgi:hypothetical protein